MMILADIDILNELLNKNLTISPISDDDIQPCSVDLHLGKELLTIHGKKIDISKGSYKLKPNEFILASTEEYVEIPKHLCGQVDGRSSVARMGVSVHQTGGYIDAGYCGNITLELYNCSDKEFELSWGDSICQIIFHVLSSECAREYGSYGLNSKYQHSQGVVRSRYKEAQDD